MKILILSIALLVSSQSMAQKYHVTSVKGSRVLVDSRYAQDPEAEKFLAPYKHIVDSVMSPLVGRSAKFMKSYGPESELSNLVADIMVWCGKKYNETPDLGIYNLGGIRAALPEGDVTFGDINDIAPFENKICFMTLTGAQLKILFQQMTQRGAGVSRGVVAVYKNNSTDPKSRDLQLLSLSLNGEPIDDTRTYRLATIDYLIQGNDGFRELRNGKDLVVPTDVESNTRYLIADYFREKLAQNILVDSNIEGRVIIKQ